MKNLTMTRNLSAKVVSTILLVGLLLSSLALNASFGTETQALVAGSWSEYANTDWYNSNLAAPDYTLTTANQLAGLAQLVNDGTCDFAGKTIKLNSNIDLGGHYWVPIGRYEGRSFKGTFNGDKHSVLNMNIGAMGNRADYKYTGLFGRMQNGTIENLILAGDSSIFASNSEVGGIVGSAENNSTIDFCTNYCKIRAYEASVAGIAGFIESSKVINCSNYGEIAGFSPRHSSFTSGIAGNAIRCEVVNCGNYSKIYSIAHDNKIAGIVAYLSGSNVHNCINCGDIVGHGEYVFDGAIIGWFDGNDISTNYYLEGSATKAVGWATLRHAQIDAVSLLDIEIYVLDTLNDFAANDVNSELKFWAADEDENTGYPVLLNAINM